MRGYLEKEDIDNFPCEDLRTIDGLWVKHSQRRFGFSVQKQIHQELGGTTKHDNKIWRTFGRRVGWLNFLWLVELEEISEKKAPDGHFPILVKEMPKSIKNIPPLCLPDIGCADALQHTVLEKMIADRFYSLVQRLEACKI